MIFIKAGSLKHRVTFQKEIVTVNENGYEETVWIDFKTLWAAVANLHGSEYFQAAAIRAEKTVKFTIRYAEGLDETMRIIFCGKNYNIYFIDNIKYQNRFIEIRTTSEDDIDGTA